MKLPPNALVPALLVLGLIPTGLLSQSGQDSKPPIVIEERDGLVAVEAEYFFKQTLIEKRSWVTVTSGQTSGIEPDGDPEHTAEASGNVYLECLPDTRRTHDDKLTGGENFSNVAGAMAILHYKVFFNNPGRYYVWVRAYSTGSEDNGIHVGIDGDWPASGQRMQWCQGKNSWRWESKQRTQEEHCGEPYKIFLDVPTAGEHEIMFSMREDGFEFDKFLLTREREFERPGDKGPSPLIRAGGQSPSQVLASIAQNQSPSPLPPPALRPANGGGSKFPAHWGEQPRIQTRDYRPLPGGYGFGSGTLARWIRFNMDQDEALKAGLVINASKLDRDGTGYYLDQGKWLAVNPDQRKQATIKTASPFPSGKYHITLHAVGENDGQSAYSVSVNGKRIGEFTSPLSGEMYSEGWQYSQSFRDIEVNSGDVIDISSSTGSRDGEEFSRARWSKLTFNPADDATRKAVENFKPSDEGASAGPVGNKSVVQSGPMLIEPRHPDGDGSVEISGDLMQWHKVTLTLDGPYSHERDRSPNPFTDHHFSVEFRHESGFPVYSVPGYFAADGDAANTSAESGTKWRAHLSPDKPGEWHYTISFTTGTLAAIDLAEKTTIQPFSGITGSFTVAETNKSGRDFRAHGRLQYTGRHHLRFAGSGNYFLKAGPDAPETMLAYRDFDGTEPGRKQSPRPGEAAPTQQLKTWAPHVTDWREGDPTWKDGLGKGLIGALNYLAGKGLNGFSFLPYNAGGDGDNVWPFVARDAKLHYDISKLAQWAIVFDHATSLGLHLHFKMQENEIDDNRRGLGKEGQEIPESLDGGKLGVERRLYCRELIARFSHNLALNWNIGEENTQTTEEIKDMVRYIHQIDPYKHNIVIHTYPNQQDKVYTPLLGNNSLLTGASLQNHWNATHQRTLKWVQESAAAGRPWVVANDEQGNAGLGVPPDPGYDGFDGLAKQPDGKEYNLHDIRKAVLWGNIMAGGAGVEYYFGYQLPQNDLVAEDFRSRDRSWDFCRIAINFFHDNRIPFWNMSNANSLIGNDGNSNGKYCLTDHDNIYLVYLSSGGTTDLDLSSVSGQFSVMWFNPRTGGDTLRGSVRRVQGGEVASIGMPPSQRDEDWLAIIRK